MAYTVKKLLESNQFPDMKLVAGKKSLDQEIKGIRIIEIEDMERCLSGGELLLTSMKVYFGETARVFRKHLEKLEKKQISGFIIKRHPEIVQKVDYYTILLKFCSEREIPVIEIPEIEYYWGIIKYVILQIYDENIARLIYFKLTHDNISNILLNGKNFEDTMKSILFLLSSMIGNPVALYYSNLTCCASTTQDLSDFVFEKNVEKYKPNIITRFEYQKQTKEHTQYITTINVLGRAEVYLVVTEVNMPLTILDYMALENAVITLQYSFMETYAKNEIEKKYQRDIEYSLLNGLLTGDELSKAATENKENYTYDSKTYDVTIEGFFDSNNELMAVTVVKNENGDKVSKVSFKNSYTGQTGKNQTPVPSSTGPKDIIHNGSPVKTGDDSPVAGYLFLFFGSVICLCGLLMEKQKNRKEDAKNEA